jgi:hypothetical protein
MPKQPEAKKVPPQPNSTASKNNDLLMMSLSSFYGQKGVMQKIIPIVNGGSACSLRLIDWFVTNYAKKNNIILTHHRDNNIIHFNVYLSYRSQLKAYSKQQFDPFRRRERILFFYERSKSVETTIGQLNFFRWVLQNELLEYIGEHSKAIEQDMLDQQRRQQHGGQQDDAIDDSDGTSPEADGRAPSNDGNRAKSDGLVTAAASASKAGKREATVVKKKRSELSKSVATRNMNHLEGTRMIRFD